MHRRMFPRAGIAHFVWTQRNASDPVITISFVIYQQHLAGLPLLSSLPICEDIPVETSLYSCLCKEQDEGAAQNHRRDIV